MGRGDRLRRRESLTGYVLLGPSLAGVGLFLIVPVFVVLGLSLQRWDLISPPEWVGLDNLRFVLTDPTIRNSFVVTIFFVLLVIPVQTTLGLVLALLLNRGLPGSRLLRIVYLAGLNAIPAQIYEAAMIDGASAWQTLSRITLPLLRPTMFFVLVTGTIASFQVFDIYFRRRITYDLS